MISLRLVHLHTSINLSSRPSLVVFTSSVVVNIKEVPKWKPCLPTSSMTSL
ncbi:hypothetical protein Hanom_Chr13g01205711 [Helianthus anomalus]